MKVLVLNCGSSSVKFQLVETDEATAAAGRDRALAKGIVENIGGLAILRYEAEGKKPLKETGVFPVFESEYGELKTSTKIRRLLPVEEYLRSQKRFAHLFGKSPAIDTIARLQAIADKNVRKYDLLHKEAN